MRGYEFVFKYRKLYLPVVLLILLYTLVFYSNFREPEETTKEEINTATTTDKSVITKKKIRKDGTVKEETVTNKDVVTKSEQKSVQKTEQKPLPRFSISSGLLFENVVGFREPSDLYLGAGVRVINNTWVEATYRFNTKEVSIGARFDF